jgi:hypothetical protein
MLTNTQAPDLQTIFKEKKRSYIRAEAVKLYEALEIHIEGKYPFHLINERRPNESAEIKEYRHKIYQNVFKSTTTRILTSLSKARKAEGFNIVWPVDNSKIPDDAKLKRYVTEDMPLINSIVDWGFETLLKMMLMDANAICVVVPLNRDAEDEFIKPFPHIFDSEDVQYVNYLAGLVVLRGEKEKYIGVNGGKYDAEVFWVIDKMKVEKWVQQDANKNFRLVDTWEHGLDEMPCFTLGGIGVKTEDGCILYESFIQGIVAWMNEAVREYSDLQAEVVQHVHSTFWAISAQECTKCRGTGRVQFNGEFIPCQADGCNNGKVNVSPFSNIVIQQSALNPSMNIPTPPAGYVQKDIEIVKVQWERIKEHIYNALASINMQFLDNVPMAQSGIAKSVDRDELDNFVHSVTTRNMLNIEQIIYLSARIRYRDLLSKEQVRELLPQFRIPMSFDLMNSSYLISEIDAARKASVSPLILSELEKQLASKKFQDDPEIHAMVEAQFDLDPLLGFSQDDKMTMLQNNGISQTDYVISCNLPRYIQVAFENVATFKDMTIQQKRLEIIKMAEAEITARKASTQIIAPQATVE